MSKETTIDIIMQDPKFIELAVKVMEMESKIDEDYLVPFEPDEEDEDTGAKIVKTRRGDYGNDISYIPVKYIRKRLDAAFNQTWSFFIVAEHRETEPFQKYSKKDEDWIDGDNYIKCIGMMVVPGLGIRMEYGVKKVFGGGESSDWKACKTDAFKKCAEAFGIYLNYADDDEEDEGGSSRKRKKGKKMDLSDVEYSDDDLSDALETEVDFGKYKGSTLQEIMDEEDDQSYIEWLAENAREDDMREMAEIVLKYYEDQEEEKSSRRKSKGKSSSRKSKSSGRSSKRNRKDEDDEDEEFMNPPEDDDEDEEEPKRRSSRSSRKSKSSSKKSSSRKSKDEDEEIDELMEACREALDDFDRMQVKSMIQSISVSNKYPKGKSKIEELTEKELKDLADVLGVE